MGISEENTRHGQKAGVGLVTFSKRYRKQSTWLEMEGSCVQIEVGGGGCVLWAWEWSNVELVLWENHLVSLSLHFQAPNLALGREK